MRISDYAPVQVQENRNQVFCSPCAGLASPRLELFALVKIGYFDPIKLRARMFNTAPTVIVRIVTIGIILRLDQRLRND